MVQGLVLINKTPRQGPLPLQQAAEWSLSDDTMLHWVHSRAGDGHCLQAVQTVLQHNTKSSSLQHSNLSLAAKSQARGSHWGWHGHRAPWQVNL